MATIDHQVTYDGSLAKLQELSGALGRPSMTRTLTTTYFDTADLALYRSGAMLRERRPSNSSKAITEAKIPTAQGLERSVGDVARDAISTLTSGADVNEVASQTKVRTLYFVGHPRLGLLAPDVVVALDEASITTDRGSDDRMEIELQLFTKLPWTSKVDSRRLDRFSSLCGTYEATYGLERSEASGYQAILPELLQ